MPANAIASILRTLVEAEVRFVVVGGMAVVLHGHLRFTTDLDLVIALDRENVLAAMRALKSLGFQPRPPVAAEQFADPETRSSSIREKGLTVFSLWSSSFPGTDVDIFAEEPVPFRELSARARIAEFSGVSVEIASTADLIAMKRTAGRPKDFDDIAPSSESNEAGDPMKRADTAPPNGWERHAADQRRAWLRLTDAERLAWLDQAKEFAADALASAKRRRARPKSEGVDPESPQPKDTGGAARR